MKNKKPLVIILIALGSLVALLALVLVGAIGYFKLPVAVYYGASDKAFVIPDIMEGYVPQGMHYCEQEEVLLLSGYRSDGAASPIYVVEAGEQDHGKLLQKVTLKNEDGTDFVGHGGGIAKYGDFVYVAGDEAILYVYSFADIMAAEQGGSVTCKGSISLKVAEEDYLIPAFVTVYQDTLVLGEFYREEVYPTPESHHMTTKAGDEHYALAVRFKLSADAEFGIVTEPTVAFSLPAQVQGLTFTEDGQRVYLSTSWGLSFSHIMEYDMTKLQREGDITVLGKQVPLYSMDSASLIMNHKIAPMSEEMAIVDGKLYVLSESASSKYIFGRLTGGKWCYATDMEKMK